MEGFVLESSSQARPESCQAAKLPGGPSDHNTSLVMTRTYGKYEVG